MDFIDVATLFEKLESTSKRLEKVMHLKSFLLKNKQEAPIIFDLIAGNYQRQIDKKLLGISLKTVISTLSFVSKETEKQIEKKFNKLGDIGLVAKDILSDEKQTSLTSKTLTLKDILDAYTQISQKTGTNKNKAKKETLSKLFLYAQKSKEYKYLARLLIDDLRIGVSEGVLREAVVNALFPRIIGIHSYCPKCPFPTLNSKICFKCKTPVDFDNQEEIIKSKNLKIVEVGTPDDVIGLDEFIGGRDEIEEIKFMLRINRKTSVIKSKNPRQIYNIFTSLFERNYNVTNSFQKIIKQIKKDLPSVFDCKITLGTPIRSMLGTRANTIEDSFEVSKKPALIDFKYDGLRVQIHNDKGKVRLFSRNLEEITKQFPEVVEFVKENFSDLSFVADTECVGYDFDTQKFLPFQLLSRRIMTKNVNEVSHIKVVVKIFDIMYLNGQTIIELPYSQRREKIYELMLNRPLRQTISFDIKKLKAFRNSFEY